MMKLKQLQFLILCPFLLFPFSLHSAEMLEQRNIVIGNLSVDYQAPQGFTIEGTSGSSSGQFKLLLVKTREELNAYGTGVAQNAENECRQGKGVYFAYHDYTLPQTARVSSCAWPDGRIAAIAFKPASFQNSDGQLYHPFIVAWKIWGVAQSGPPGASKTGNPVNPPKEGTPISENIRQKAALSAKGLGVEASNFLIIAIRTLSAQATKEIKDTHIRPY